MPVCLCYVFFSLVFWSHVLFSRIFGRFRRVCMRGKKTHCEWNLCVKIISDFQSRVLHPRL